MTPERNHPAPPADDPVWTALDHLRDSAPVAEARRFADGIAARRERRRAFRDRLAVLVRPVSLAVAGCAVAVAALVLTPAPRIEPETIATAVGQRKTVLLADGSKLMLDTDTRLTVALEQGERRLELINGQANFEVAHDRDRPFRVRASGMTVTAIGTNFDVAVLPGLRAVTLVRGRVAAEASPRADHAAPDRVLLSPGQRIEVGADGRLGRPRAIDLKNVLAWQQGRLEFDNITVAEAIAEANRYARTKIRLAHRPSAARHIDGVFEAGRTGALVAALCAYLDLKVVARSDQEIVLDRHDG